MQQIFYQLVLFYLLGKSFWVPARPGQVIIKIKNGFGFSVDNALQNQFSGKSAGRDRP